MKKIALFIPLCVLGACAPIPLELNQQIVLSAGETKQVGPDGFEITLRTLSDASGCVSADDCSIMVFDGTVVARVGGKSELSQIQASIRPGQVVPLDVDGYAFQLTGVKHDANNRAQALFIVLGKK